MLRTASFCLRRSLLVRSASYSVRAEVLAMERRRCAAPAPCVKSMLLLLVLVWGNEAMNSVLLRVGKVKLGDDGSFGRALALNAGVEPGAGAEVLMINAGLATGCRGGNGLAGVLMLVAAYAHTCFTAIVGGVIGSGLGGDSRSVGSPPCRMVSWLSTGLDSVVGDATLEASTTSMLSDTLVAVTGSICCAALNGAPGCPTSSEFEGGDELISSPRRLLRLSPCAAAVAAALLAGWWSPDWLEFPGCPMM